MPRAAGEMPFLDHLEELRSRILRSLLAIIGCFALGLWLVDRFQLVNVLKAPIAPYLPGGRLTVLSPTEPLMIVLKLGFILGLVLASPVILWQLWAFLSPALYEKEKKTLVPALFAGMVLFLGGAVASFVFIVPQALRVLLSFQAGSFNTTITFDAYFSFVMQLVLALGLSCELPLLMIILAGLGILTTPLLNRIRPYAIVGSFVAGAILSPGTDILSMFMLTIPLLFLYEIGVAGVWVVQRRRLKAESAAALGLLLLVLARPAGAQQPTAPRPALRPAVPGAVRGDTTRPPPVRALDSASARRLGLPSAPKRSFPAPDSIMTQLLELKDFTVTRYQADTAVVHATGRIVDLHGNAMTEHEGSVLEAKAIMYREGACSVDATGEPHLFQGGQVLIGNAARFDTCKERAVVSDALTTFAQGGGNWFIRGHLAIDSSQSRLYGARTELTSCDLPIPHYHFSAREIKWVSKSVLVARPTVLYVRDVPIAWLPFLFQDTKTERHSGILIPQFGFNDIVRPQRNYNRQVTNIGYYWAPNDYFDAKAQLDWFANRYIDFGIDTKYRLISRFVNGSLSASIHHEAKGQTAKSYRWAHTQTINNTTTLNFDAQYSTNSSIIARNAIDPRVTTASIRSGGQLNKRYSWGTVSLGGDRTESITDGSGSMTLPRLDITPKSIDFGTSVTWSPSVSFTSTKNFKTPLGSVVVAGDAPGKLDTIPLTGHNRVSSFSMQTPLRIGGFNWNNQVRVVDGDSTGRRVDTFKVPNESTPEPNDSITVTQVRGGGFGTTLDWDTGINLPIFFRSTWKLTPGVGITNVTGGPFAVRNAFTDGKFIHQGKRLQFTLSASPTFFNIFGGFAGVQKFRHTVSPQISYSYSPEASIAEEYARAVARPGQPLVLKSPASQQISLTLNQNLEAKGAPTPGDTSGLSARKFRVLSISTSQVSYDFEQAKLPGRTGWTSSSLGNSFASDLLPGFDLRISHDLWDGPVGYKTSKFSPFLSSVSSTFQLTGNTVRGIGALFGLAKRPEPGTTPGSPQAQQPNTGGFAGAVMPGGLRNAMLMTPSQSLGRGGRPFSASATISISRIRPAVDANGNPVVTKNQSTLALNTSFSPTRFWGLTWATNYNSTAGRFESQQIQLTRDLHEWRAAFSFQKSPNGNFAFYFSIFLSDLPELKFDYNQTTIRP